MPFEHYCYCGKWGSFGYRVRLLKSQPGEWFCFEHRPPKITSAPPAEEDGPVQIPTPTRFVRRCEFCGSDLDMRQDGIHQWTSGWVMQRTGGGGHGISLPERANRWAHRHCVERAIQGHTDQRSMFDEPITRGGSSS